MKSFIVPALALLASAGVVVSPASAAIFIYDTPGAVQPDENVLLNNGQTGITVLGFTNTTGTSVTFESLNGELLSAPSNGQARVEATDGSLDALAFYLTNPALSFTEVEFNLFDALTSNLSVTLTFNGTETLTHTLGNGQNFFSALATDGDVITRVVFDTTGSGVKDIRQIRIGGIDDGVGEPPVVPEPATWAMMIAGFGMIGAGARWRNRKLTVTYA